MHKNCHHIHISSSFIKNIQKDENIFVKIYQILLKSFFFRYLFIKNEQVTCK